MLWIIISEIKSFNKEYPETEKNTKIHGRNALYNAIIGLLIVFYFIYNEIKDLI